MIFFDGLTPEEVAERTGSSVTVVRHNLYLGLGQAQRTSRSPPINSAAYRLGIFHMMGKTRSVGSCDLTIQECSPRLIPYSSQWGAIRMPRSLMARPCCTQS
jgi:hypothetical protein